MGRVSFAAPLCLLVLYFLVGCPQKLGEAGRSISVNGTPLQLKEWENTSDIAVTETDMATIYKWPEKEERIVLTYGLPGKWKVAEHGLYTTTLRADGKNAVLTKGQLIPADEVNGQEIVYTWETVKKHLKEDATYAVVVTPYKKGGYVIDCFDRSLVGKW